MEAQKSTEINNQHIKNGGGGIRREKNKESPAFKTAQ